MSDSMIVGQSFSIYLRQVGQLSALVQQLGEKRKASELVREALDDLFEKYQKPAQAEPETTGE